MRFATNHNGRIKNADKPYSSMFADAASPGATPLRRAPPTATAPDNLHALDMGPTQSLSRRASASSANSQDSGRFVLGAQPIRSIRRGGGCCASATHDSTFSRFHRSGKPHAATCVGVSVRCGSRATAVSAKRVTGILGEGRVATAVSSLSSAGRSAASVRVGRWQGIKVGSCRVKCWQRKK